MTRINKIFGSFERLTQRRERIEDSIRVEKCTRHGKTIQVPPVTHACRCKQEWRWEHSLRENDGDRCKAVHHPQCSKVMDMK